MNEYSHKYVPDDNLDRLDGEQKFNQCHHYIDEPIDDEITYKFWVIILIWYLSGSAIFVWLENWSYIDGLYFCFVTMTSIGFGDIMV